MPRSTNKSATNKSITNNSAVNNPVVQNRLPINPNPSLFSSIKQGFGFGIGSSIAHNIFDSKPQSSNAHNIFDSNPKSPLVDKTTEFKQCMEKTYNNYEECAPILK